MNKSQKYRISRAGKVLTKENLAEDPDYVLVELQNQMKAPWWEQLICLELAEIEEEENG